jgi:hypothetical protein
LRPVSENTFSGVATPAMPMPASARPWRIRVEDQFRAKLTEVAEAIRLCGRDEGAFFGSVLGELHLRAQREAQRAPLILVPDAGYSVKTC